LFVARFNPLNRSKKVENISTFYYPASNVTGSIGKFLPMAHAWILFCSNPVRSAAYFPECKLALTKARNYYLFQNNGLLEIKIQYFY
jgi:hypothetical protein